MRDYKNAAVFDLLYWAGLLLLMILPVFSIGDQIGLYFDSVYPDYAATQVLDPQLFQERWFVAYPYLCPVYHGTVGVWISAFVMLLTGTTGVLQHHITNIILEFIVIFLMDRILAGSGVSAIIRRLLLLVLAISPTVCTIAMTQYYIELPGTICIFCAILVYRLALKTLGRTRQMIYIFLTFFLIGFAFYSYFNFLFFFPGFLIYLLLDKKIAYDIGTKLVLACYGLLAGSVLYVAGYTQMAVTSIAGYVSKGLPIAAWALVWLLCALMLLLMIKKKNKLAYFGTMFLFISGIILLILGSSYLKSMASSLSLSGYFSVGSLLRLKLLLRNLYYALSGVSAEGLILSEQVSVGWKWLICSFALVILLYTMIAVIHKDLKNNITSLICIMVIYLIPCFALITRMQTQHFIPLIFWTFLVIAMALQYLLDHVGKGTGTIHIRARYISAGVKICIAAFILMLGSLFLTNRFKVVDRIIETGGRGYYTNQINNLATTALDHKNDGEREVYIFPEWGFMAGFNYITGNDIAFTTNYSTEMIKGLLEQGYEVNIIYWNSQDSESTAYYEDVVEELDVSSNIENYYSNEGELIFSNLVVTKQKQVQ